MKPSEYFRNILGWADGGHFAANDERLEEKIIALLEAVENNPLWVLDNGETLLPIGENNYFIVSDGTKQGFASMKSNPILSAILELRRIKT
jgi:hypothetical protein